MNLLSPVECVNKYNEAGVVKAASPFSRLFVLAIIAGAMVAITSATANTAVHSFTNVSTLRTVNGLLFGFVLGMVMLAGAELFTGNNLIVISVCQRTTSISKTLRNWVIVYLGNFAGGVIVAILLVHSGQFNYSEGGLAVYSMKVAAGKLSLTFGSAVILGIFCNVLVCFGVLFSLSAKDVIGKIMGAYVPVSMFAICGFEHCVANMYYIPAGIFAASVPRYAELAAQAGIDLSLFTWARFLSVNLLPVSIGNIIGGVTVGLMMWYGHIRSSK